jgi:predicted RecB family nuclease
MKKHGEYFELSASDLVGYLNCQHLSELDRAVAEGVKEKPKIWDLLLEVLWERGAAHEQDYVRHLKNAGFETLRIDGVDMSEKAVSQTLEAMKSGTPVIVQGALAHDGWSGRADILRRVEKPSALGAWSYEIIDTKLARETKGGTVLQLCLYADLLQHAQGVAPEYVYVVAPRSDFEPQQFRYLDYAAYFRRAKRGIEAAIDAEEAQDEYPDPQRTL